MSEILTTVFSQCKNLTQRVIQSPPSSTFGLEALETYELVEIKDGLLATPKKELMKARAPELFPEIIQEYICNAEKIESNQMYIGIENITIRTETRTSVFKMEFYEYLRGLGVREYYLSNIPLPGENNRLYPLIAKYKYGVCVVAPVEV